MDQLNIAKKFSSSRFDFWSSRFYQRIKQYKRKDVQYCNYVRRFLEGNLFSLIMISTISFNAVCMVLQTYYDLRYHFFFVFEVLEILFNAVYYFEFCIKFYVDLMKYWKNGYNILDVIIIIILWLPQYLRKNFRREYGYINIAEGIQAFRILKLIPYSRGIKTLISALGQTICTVASVLVLLFLLMFIFAILGFCLYGTSEEADMENWGNLAVAFFTLFSLTTVDGWTDLQGVLDERGYMWSRAFTIIFILVGSFVFLSMFIAVMIIHTEDSIKKFTKVLSTERQLALIEDKQRILKKQQEEINALMQREKGKTYKSFSDLVRVFKKSLNHTDPMVLEDFCATLSFIDIYLSSLDNQDNTVLRLQELYYEMVNVLNQMIEDKPMKKPSVTSEMSADI
ncbi:cation channel sperm-associated protein 3 isoform X1 [Monodelphis domestica]|uniref:Cation channel sperm associated 3 n=2 Tax=Monodelphis domestica TaxID=13616 RepID=F6TI60_MONDO|nr:cation channel sperm-associated protein 3 isoform X1 [Monodelphis domestica]